ncbi:MAG: hypothetical protein JSV86_17185 [Gemmatimonadota bacterium]|nr:MAG: hypothetical protein JSV86_17185 [Gemmatimonadota bacterium]
MAEMKKDLTSLQAQSAACSEILVAVKEALVEHKVRLENGSKVFERHGSRITAIEDTIRPKPPGVLKIVSVTVGILVACATALWGLSTKLSDRPTVEQVEKVIDTHDTHGHKAVEKDLDLIRSEQAAQRVLINNLDDDIEKQAKKIDTILQRVESPPRRRRPQ